MTTDLQAGIAAFETENYAQARAILEPLAQAGDAEAQCLTGNLYQLGLGVEQDLPQAAQWYERSSAQGYAVAANNLAGLRLTGYGDIPPDTTKARQLFQRAKSLGFEHTPASIELLP